MDAACLLLTLGFLAIELIFENRLTYYSLGVLLISRIYLRVPFLVALLIHHYKLKLCQIQQNIIFPNNEKLEFATYKEKVLFIINNIRKQFSKVIYMNQPNNDLAWCAFVIENDYLQISNSISSTSGSMSTTLHNVSKQSSAEGEPDIKKDKYIKVKGTRRFSKTISLNFGEKTKNTVDSMKMKKIERISIDCTKGNYQELF